MKSTIIRKINKFGYNNTSQYGEDGIINYIVNKVTVPNICIEFGAWDGKFMSNTYSLWHDNNWEGILIESNSERCSELQNNYSNSNIKVFNHFVEPNGENSLDQLFIDNNLSKEIGVLSIDVDSTDYHIWKNLEYIKPSIVIIEHNHSIPGFVDYNDPEEEVFLRCSAKALERLGREKGYKLICCTHTNSIFVKDKIFNNRYFPDETVEYLYDYSNINHMISAAQGPAQNLISIVYGQPSSMQKLVYPIINRIKALIKGKKYKIPSKKVMDSLNKSGMQII